MKTIILFSSIFYLLRLKLGNTLSFFRQLAAPVKSVISMPVEKAEKTTGDGNSYFWYYEKTVQNVKRTQKDSLKVTQNLGITDPSGVKTEKLN